MNKKCVGCGVTLQTKESNSLGYTPKEGSAYCQRCFRINNYNEAKEIELPVSNEEIIEFINKHAKHVLFISDVLNISNEVLSCYEKISVNKTLVINKIDLLPKSYNKEKLSTFLQDNYNIKDVVFASASKNVGIKQLLEIITKETNIYIVGFTNSGKSSLINALSKNNKITTSIVPNTTTDFIRIKIMDKAVYDSPGFVYQNNIANIKNLELQKDINNQKNYKPVTLQTKVDDHILIADLMELVINNINSLTFYMSNDINVKKTYKPMIKAIKKEYKVDANSDVIIKGLGFVNIKKATILQIVTDYQDLIEIRPSIIGK